MLRRVAATVLTVTAEGMTMAAKGVQILARVVQTPPPAPKESRPGAGRVVTPPSVAVTDAPSHLRTAATHEEELAGRTAADVVAQVPSLSTDELRRLYEYESANKKRKTVLDAIEQQSVPVRG